MFLAPASVLLYAHLGTEGPTDKHGVKCHIDKTSPSVLCLSAAPSAYIWLRKYKKYTSKSLRIKMKYVFLQRQRAWFASQDSRSDIQDKDLSDGGKAQTHRLYGSCYMVVAQLKAGKVVGSVAVCRH